MKKNRAETNITKGSQTNSLSKEVGLEGPFEGVKCGDVAGLRRASVPEGGR